MTAKEAEFYYNFISLLSCACVAQTFLSLMLRWQISILFVGRIICDHVLNHVTWKTCITRGEAATDVFTANMA